jgi:transposase
VWQSVRLPGRTKARLLDRFVLGVPVWRQRAAAPASAGSMERFYRLCRACCAFEEGLPHASLSDPTRYGAMDHREQDAAHDMLVLRVEERLGSIRAVLVAPCDQGKILPGILSRSPPGALLFTDAGQAFATVATRGGRVILREGRGTPFGRKRTGRIETFWRQASHWLHLYRGVPLDYFHLYLAEVCWRFNHRHGDPRPLLLQRLKTLGIADIRPILVRNGRE